MIRLNQIKLKINHTDEELELKVLKLLRIPKERLEKIQVYKKSIDARDKPELKYVYTIDAYVKDENKLNPHIFGSNVAKAVKDKYSFKCTGEEKLKNPPVIIGMGPAGLFAAYLLALNGYKPIILERGKSVDERHKDVCDFWDKGVLDITSNVQFGEGGAGTFSDGKLNTMVKDKFGRNHFVLETFHKFGAKEEITYINKPHIGTDVLINVVKNMREEIIRLGGTVKFSSQVTDFVIENNKLVGVKVNDCEIIETNVCVLAVGHSARDTFRKLLERGFTMEPKNFAVGVRIEHPQEMIDKAMYGFSTKDTDKLSTADYKLTGHSTGGRNVFSFCMCPGGYVVNASSGKEQTVVNGMSYSKRDSENANSAIIVSVTKEDYLDDDALSGVRFQEELEKKAFTEGKGKVPIQLFGDFCNNTKSTKLLDIKPCIKGEYEFSNLNNVLPKDVCEALKECVKGFGKTIPGYDREDAVMSGVESRTSSPVRILRNDDFESNILGVYPCGEGAGYAGGITSAAMDGIKVFEAISSKYRFM